MTSDATPGTAALQKGINILKLIAREKQPFTFVRLQNTTGFPKGTLHRILQALMNEGLVRYREHDRSYHLGLTLLQLASQVLDDLDVREIAHPELVKLRDVSGELVHIAVPGKESVVYIDVVESDQPVGPARWALGSSSDYHCSAVGKAIAANLSEPRLTHLLKRLPMKRYTDTTITSRRQFRHDLEVVRNRGFALAKEEEFVGIHGIAAPIFDLTGEPCAGICITIPSFRFDPKKVNALAASVVDTAHRISKQLGNRG